MVNPQEDRCPVGDPTTPAEAIPVQPGTYVPSLALNLLALLAVIFTLQWGRDVFIPLMLGLIISYALTPLVDRLQAWRIPRALGAALLLIGILGGAGSVAYTLSDEAIVMIEAMPSAARKLRESLRNDKSAASSSVDKVQRAAVQLESLANESATPAVPAKKGAPPVMRVQIEKPQTEGQSYLWIGTMGFAGMVGQATVVLFLAYFLLASGDAFRRKLVRITGPSLSKKKITLLVLGDISSQIQRYLLVQAFTSVVVGVATWLALAWLGLENAALWGIAAGLFNSIPYLGPVVVTTATTLVAFTQFGTLNMALWVGGITLLITTVEGFLLTPWLTGRASQMSAVVVFVGVLFWGWLWGVWGLLLGMPILMMVKSVCDRVEDLKPIGELLGD